MAGHRPHGRGPIPQIVVVGPGVQKATSTHAMYPQQEYRDPRDPRKHQETKGKHHETKGKHQDPKMKQKDQDSSSGNWTFKSKHLKPTTLQDRNKVVSEQLQAGTDKKHESISGQGSRPGQSATVHGDGMVSVQANTKSRPTAQSVFTQAQQPPPSQRAQAPVARRVQGDPVARRLQGDQRHPGSVSTLTGHHGYVAGGVSGHHRYITDGANTVSGHHGYVTSRDSEIHVETSYQPAADPGYQPRHVGNTNPVRGRPIMVYTQVPKNHHHRSKGHLVSNNPGRSNSTPNLLDNTMVLVPVDQASLARRGPAHRETEYAHTVNRSTSQPHGSREEQMRREHTDKVYSGQVVRVQVPNHAPGEERVREMREKPVQSGLIVSANVPNYSSHLVEHNTVFMEHGTQGRKVDTAHEKRAETTRSAPRLVSASSNLRLVSTTTTNEVSTSIQTEENVRLVEFRSVSTRVNRL